MSQGLAMRDVEGPPPKAWSTLQALSALHGIELEHKPRKSRPPFVVTRLGRTCRFESFDEVRDFLRLHGVPQ